MSFDLDALRLAVSAHGTVVRVVVAGAEGSAPREAGAAMMIWADGQQGTIGGGALEFAAAAQARILLASGSAARLDRLALGPALGQCCGGAVRLLSERWDAAALAALSGPLVVRGVDGRAMPLSVRRLVSGARGQGRQVAPVLLDGWMVEPVCAPTRAVWIWGAGHVGRALVAVLGPLPGLTLTWIDTAAARFPTIPDGVLPVVAADPARLVRHAPEGADHIIVTFSHALDLDLCHHLLQQGFATCGLIGSATKWARFRQRLRALGHADAAIDRIACPIGQPALGKHPQAIAVGVAADFLARPADVAQGSNTDARKDAG